MKKVALLAILFLLISAVSPLAFADDTGKGWWPKASEKLGRGVSNVVFSLLEIPYNVTKEYQTMNPVGAIPSGILKGAGWTVMRACAGVIDIATFLIPTKPLISDFDMGWWTL